MTGADHRTRPRRRGKALVDGILDAVTAELVEHGYGAVTMDAVARRAGASKASLYRRWPHLPALVIEAMYRAMPTVATAPDCGDLREDLLALSREISAQLAGPIGSVVRGLFAEALRDPDVMTQVQEYSRGNSLQIVRLIVERAAARGECRPEDLTARRLEAGPALLRLHFLTTGRPPDDGVIVEIVDEVMLRLLGVGG